MKPTKTALTLLLLTLCNLGFTQNITDYSKLKKQTNFYLGFGTGINHSCGLLGIKLTGRLTETVLIDASAGIGSWGNKIGVNAIFNAKNENTWCPYIGISRAMGQESVPLMIETISPSGLKTTNTHNVKCDPATMFNIGFQRQWLRPTGNRITLDLGYSVLVGGANATLLTPGYSLTDMSKQSLSFIKPGGLTVGFAYYFALN